MGWVVPWTRYGDWLKAGEVGDEDHLINGLTCTAEIRSLAICCPACGADYEVKASGTGTHLALALRRPVHVGGVLARAAYGTGAERSGPK